MTVLRRAAMLRDVPNLESLLSNPRNRRLLYGISTIGTSMRYAVLDTQLVCTPEWANPDRVVLSAIIDLQGHAARVRLQISAPAVASSVVFCCVAIGWPIAFVAYLVLRDSRPYSVSDAVLSAFAIAATICTIGLFRQFRKVFRDEADALLDPWRTLLGP